MTDMLVFEISPNQIVLSAQDLLRAIGYEHGAPASIERTLNLIWDEAFSLIEPAAGCRILPVETGDGVIFTGGVSFSVKKIISTALKGCECVALFTATIGSRLEQRASRYGSDGETLKMYLFDVIATEAVEKVASLMQSRLAGKLAEEGLSITNRYSPGYCGWDTAQQQILFSLLPVNFCGVSLTASSMMLPVKSVSGVIGIGADVSFRDYGCALCDKTGCIRRGR